MSYDIIIVGAGIVGTACALECSRAGMRTLILERGCIGGGTTAAGMGHLVVMDDSEAQFALTSFSRQLWTELRPEFPAAVEFDGCGTLWVAADYEEMEGARHKQVFYRERGVRTELVAGDDLARFEPNLRGGLAGGLRVIDDGVVYPSGAAFFFLERAKAAGAEFRVATVDSILPEGGVRLKDGLRIPAARTVSATGPWSPQLTPGLPVRSRKGHLLITDRARGFVHHQIVELGYLKSAHASDKDSVAFNIQPRVTGQMLIGSSRQFDVVDTTIDHAILSRMLKRAIEYLPGLANLSATRTWTGTRPATPDNLPIIGPSVASDRVWLATGHEGLGITTSLGTARLLADMLLGRPSKIPTAPYSPARFSKS